MGVRESSFCGFCSLEGYLFFHCFFFPLMAFWLLGFLASWLLGFLASWLLGFSASWLWPFASSAFPVPLRQVAFRLLRLLAGWLLHPFIGFRMWLPASSASPVPPYLNHHFFEHHGGEAPLQPTRYCLDCLQSNCTPI